MSLDRIFRRDALKKTAYMTPIIITLLAKPSSHRLARDKRTRRMQSETPRTLAAITMAILGGIICSPGSW